MLRKKEIKNYAIPEWRIRSSTVPELKNKYASNVMYH